MEKYVEKSQYKKSDEVELVFGPVFADDGATLVDEGELMTRERDPAIYNDHDFYRSLLSDFLNANGIVDDADEMERTQAGNEDFLFGADLSLTQKFLAKKQKLKDL